MPAEALDETFLLTLSGNYDSDDSWKAVCELQKLGSRNVFDRAVAWCGSQEPLKRARGADILARIGNSAEHPHNRFPGESFAVISRMARYETESLPLASAIHAMGYLENAQAIDIMIEHRFHRDAKVRFALAAALGRFANDSLATPVLIQLAHDPDGVVRDWATFAIGECSDIDTPDVREALFRNLGDPFEDARQEAIAGLAKRKDSRVFPALIDSLRAPDVPEIIIDAASTMLGRENVGNWYPADFITALQKKFGP